MIGFIGGTGPEGRGLALRFALAGERVILGSRDAARARNASESIAQHVDASLIFDASNDEVPDRAETVFLTVPYHAQRPTLEALGSRLAGKTVVDVVAPVVFHKGVARSVPVAEGSAALEAQALAPDAHVVAAFQTVSAHDLLAPDKSVDSDVVVCADHVPSKETVMALAEKIRGVRAVNGGGLDNAAYVEGMTTLLLNINKTYKARSAIRIVGIGSVKGKEQK